MKTLITITCLLAGILVQAQNTIHYTFDKRGRLVTEHLESFYQVQFSYDVEGNIISKAVTNYSSLAILHNEENGNSVKVYPNPAHDFFMVECNDIHLKGEISIVDISGREIGNEILIEGKASINVRNYKSGIYLVKVKTPKESHVTRLVKE